MENSRRGKFATVAQGSQSSSTKESERRHPAKGSGTCMNENSSSLIDETQLCSFPFLHISLLFCFVLFLFNLFPSWNNVHKIITMLYVAE